jgi:hypothetical protein
MATIEFCEERTPVIKYRVKIFATASRTPQSVPFNGGEEEYWYASLEEAHKALRERYTVFPYTVDASTEGRFAYGFWKDTDEYITEYVELSKHSIVPAT